MWLNTSCPRSPADSMRRSPAPIIRSKSDWLEARSLTFSSGMSRMCLARIPERNTSRSLVTTKWVSCQLTSRLPSQTAQPTASTTVSHRPPVWRMSLFCCQETTRRTSTGMPAKSGPAKNHQWGRRSRATVSPSSRSRFGKGMVQAYDSLVPLATEHIGRDGANAVQKQQPVQMVELVEKGPGFEGVGLDHPHSAVGGDPPDDDLRGPGDVAGEVGDRQAPLAGQFLVAGQDEDGIEQHERAVAGVGLLVAGDVDGEGPERHADLGSGDADARRRGEHRVEQVGGQGLLLGADVGHGVGHPLQHSLG